MDGPTLTTINVISNPERTQISESRDMAAPFTPTEDGDKQFLNEIQTLYAFLAQAIHLF